MSKTKLFVFTITIIIILLAFFPYDTDDSFNALSESHRKYIVEGNACSDSDGIGLSRKPFGVIISKCDRKVFSLFNKLSISIR